MLYIFNKSYMFIKNFIYIYFN